MKIGSLSDDDWLGARKPDPDTLKPLKVRLPLSHVLQLHQMRIMGDQTVSEIVTAALVDYMEELQRTKLAAEPVKGPSP